MTRPGRLRVAHMAGRGRPAGLHCRRTYGLTPSELRAEMRRLAARGWALWELRTRFECDCTSKDSSE
ncbi:hypothetical protein [Streptomyces sp. ID05-47C]|uniref:hypothetical protein n=1 Tax=Streptomyces sp. ID05-47C TaxID=3028665 RepID=UPI0029AF4472|nr:hypothetical protein [Streptomyces sp. ID05-47C]MDX3570802.1 hypothetical protein [Streptomyces sp. ID05-47C]